MAILFRLLKPFKYLVLSLFALILLTAIFESFGLALLLPILDIILQEDSTSKLNYLITFPLKILNIENDIIFIGLFSIAVIVIKNIAKSLTVYFNSKIVFSIRKDWILKINNYYMYCPYSEIIKQKQGILVNNLVYETQKAANGILKINDFLISALMVLSYIILLFLTDPYFALLSLLVFGFIFSLSSYLGKNKLALFGREELSLNQETNAIATENISAIRQVRTFAIEKKINDILSDYVERLKIIGVKYEFIKSLPRAFVEVVIFSCVISIIIVFHNEDPNKLQSFIPVLSIFVITSQRLMSQFNILIGTKYSFDFYRPTFELIQSLIDRSIKYETPYLLEEGKNINTIDTDIHLKNISFSYKKEKKVINNLNFKIKKGEINAIYGHSGSGKSTLADLLLGLYKPTKGSIYINGNSLYEYNIDSWRQLIGFVSQDNYLFHGTILDNIKVGKENVTMDEILKSVKTAQAFDFINNLPDKFETIVGDRGVLLSGGQKQRIAIARAMIRDPDLFIFDEATSALDLTTEQKLLDIIFNLSKNKTVLIITHKMDIINKVSNVLKI